MEEKKRKMEEKSSKGKEDYQPLRRIHFGPPDDEPIEKISLSGSFERTVKFGPPVVIERAVAIKSPRLKYFVQTRKQSVGLEYGLELLQHVADFLKRHSDEIPDINKEITEEEVKMRDKEYDEFYALRRSQHIPYCEAFAYPNGDLLLADKDMVDSCLRLPPKLMDLLLASIYFKIDTLRRVASTAILQRRQEYLDEDPHDAGLIVIYPGDGSKKRRGGD